MLKISGRERPSRFHGRRGWYGYSEMTPILPPFRSLSTPLVFSERDKTAEGLDGFLDEPGPETSGTDPHSTSCTVNQCPDWLEIGPKHTFGSVVGMTDVIPNLSFFATDITCKCHDGYSYSSVVGHRVTCYHRCRSKHKKGGVLEAVLPSLFATSECLYGGY